MEDGTYWLGIWRLVGACFCVLVVSLSGCSMNRAYQVRVLIETAKVHPLDAGCAIYGDGDRSSLCTVRATK